MKFTLIKKIALNFKLLNLFVLIFLFQTFINAFAVAEINTSQKANQKKHQKSDRAIANADQLIESFDYPNADIKEVVKAISKLMQRNFILDPAVRGKISIIAPTKITVEEAYNAFLSALALNNLTVVKSGNFYKIRQTRDAKQDNIALYTGKNFPNNDQLITRIIKVRYLNVDQIQKNITQLISKSGQVTAYQKTNSLIITGYANNIARIAAIMKELDVPGFEEKLAVIPIYHANAEKMSKLLNQIINPGKSSSSSSRFSRFSRNKNNNSGKSGAESYSLVVSDERSNSIVVVGNHKGISKMKSLIKKLDTELSAEEAGGVYVYYVKHAEAEKIASVLSKLTKNLKAKKKPNIIPRNSFFRPTTKSENKNNSGLLGDNVKLTADKVTNSLIITANKQDYQTVLSLLQKLDIPRDQVFVKAIIMELSADNSLKWGVNALKFIKTPAGISRVGFNTSALSDVLNPIESVGAVLGFGGGASIELPVAVGGVKAVSSLLGLIELLKKTSHGNVLYTPQITAMDNEEALIKVGSKVPVAKTSSASAVAGVSSGIEREEVAVELKFTPYINRENGSVRLKINQKIQSVSDLAKVDINKGVKTNIRQLKTLLTIQNGDTAVLGGLTQTDTVNSQTKVPLLGDIPLLGWLFKGVNKKKERKNIMVFITPKIIKNESQQNTLFLEKLEERLGFIDKYLNNAEKLKAGTYKALKTNAIPSSPSANNNSLKVDQKNYLDDEDDEGDNKDDDEFFDTELLKDDNLDLDQKNN